MENKMTAQAPTATSSLGPIQIAFLTGGCFALKELATDGLSFSSIANSVLGGVVGYYTSSTVSGRSWGDVGNMLPTQIQPMVTALVSLRIVQVVREKILPKPEPFNAALMSSGVLGVFRVLSLSTLASSVGYAVLGGLLHSGLTRAQEQGHLSGPSKEVLQKINGVLIGGSFLRDPIKTVVYSLLGGALGASLYIKRNPIEVT